MTEYILEVRVRCDGPSDLAFAMAQMQHLPAYRTVVRMETRLKGEGKL